MSHLFLSRNIEDGNARAGAAPAPRVWLFSFEVAATMWAHWGGVPCAVHCSELAGVFFNKPPSNASAEGRLVRTMVRHLLLFVASGDPNGKAAGTTPSPPLATWPPFVVSGAGAGQNMVFALEETGGGGGIRVEQGYRQAACDYWETLPGGPDG
jgi:hypothetical protein